MLQIWLLIPFLLLSIAAILALIFSRFRALTPVHMGWLLAPFPLAGAAVIAWLIFPVQSGQVLTLSVTWIPSLNISLSLYLDGLSALFALLVTGINALILVYSGYYFKHEQGVWRFLVYLLLFTIAMLGVVLAGDLITLFIFWELTSITSYLLIAYKYKDAAARRNAFKALLITAGGGIALLVGLLLIGQTVGGFDYPTILSGGNSLRNSPLYPLILFLVALGAFTKSAQFPFHVWLPDAMSAPTPASAFLHSATMVKAGIYLLARLNPSLGYTDLWFWLLTGVGLWTMLTGAYLGFKQNDLKALLAYSTISQLGILVALIGQDTEIAFKAFVIGVLAHALYKSALFMMAGIIDHGTGTRDLRKLGGLWREMPLSFAVTAVAALSMAGLPPLFGFLAKETLLATAVHPDLPELIDSLFPIFAVVAGALILAQAGLLVYGTFLGKRASLSELRRAHDPPVWMWLAPAIPALLSLLLAQLPEPLFEARLLAEAASIAYGDSVKVSLALWTGINVPLLLSMVAISLGGLIFLLRNRIRPWMQQLVPQFSLNRAYAAVLEGIDWSADRVTRLQAGYLRGYLTIILIGVGGLLIIFGALPLSLLDSQFFVRSAGWEVLDFLRVLVLLLAVLSALISVFMRRDIASILALGISGLTVAIWMALEPAPDVALVQITVDLLTTVILVLCLVRLPRSQREKAQEFTFRQSRRGLIGDAFIAVASGAVVAIMVFAALSSKPRVSQVSPYFEINAKPLTGARDIVGAILVDFRGFDTLVEITVFASAGIGLYMLLHYAARKAGDREDPDPTFISAEHPTTGIVGPVTSPLLRLLAYSLLPLVMVLGIIQVIYGHDQPGDGFTAGVFIALAIELYYIIFGYHSSKQQLPWLKPALLIAVGILLVLINGLVGALLGTGFMSPLNYGQLIGMPLPEGFYLSSSFVFELAVCLVVLGSAVYIVDNLGRPKEQDSESDALLTVLDQDQA